MELCRVFATSGLRDTCAKCGEWGGRSAMIIELLEARQEVEHKGSYFVPSYYYRVEGK